VKSLLSYQYFIGKKRKFQIDDDELAAIAKREQEEALKKLEEEKVNFYFRYIFYFKLANYFFRRFSPRNLNYLIFGWYVHIYGPFENRKGACVIK
jgi:hypothetical protein